MGGIKKTLRNLQRALVKGEKGNEKNFVSEWGRERFETIHEWGATEGAKKEKTVQGGRGPDQSEVDHGGRGHVVLTLKNPNVIKPGSKAVPTRRPT